MTSSTPPHEAIEKEIAALGIDHNTLRKTLSVKAIRSFATRIATLARKEALEEAADVCDKTPLAHPGRADMTASQLAAAIRSLITTDTKSI